MKKFLFLVPLALLLTFCAPAGPAAMPSPDVAAIVEATLTAYVPSEAEILPAPTLASGGAISGRLSYPSEAIPPLKVVAFRVGSSEIYTVETTLNQTTYRIENLPEGKYNVVALTPWAATASRLGFRAGIPRLCSAAWPKPAPSTGWWMWLFSTAKKAATSTSWIGCNRTSHPCRKKPRKP